MKHFVLGILCTLLVLTVGALAYLLLGFAEARGDLPPSHLESALMTRGACFGAPGGAGSGEPVPTDRREPDRRR